MIIRTSNISLVSFSPEHIETIYQIRNDESVRAGMRDTAPIPWESHVRWAQENLIDQRKQELFVVFQDDAPVGIALLRDFGPHSAEIGIIIRNAASYPMASYFAAYLLAHYAFYHLDMEVLYSEVPRHNERALRFNLKCGFVPAAAPDDEYHHLKLVRDTAVIRDLHKKFGARHNIEVIPEADELLSER